MVIDWSLISDNLTDVPPLVQRVAQFLVVLVLFWAAYALVGTYLERRREAVGWDERKFQTQCAIWRAIILIIGLVVAGASVGLVVAKPFFDFVQGLVSVIFTFVGTIVQAALWAVALALVALAVAFVLGARDAALGLIGGLILRSQWAGKQQLPRAGDRVQIGDRQGAIESFSLLSTRLKQDDGSVVFVSNAWVVEGGATVLGAGAGPQPTALEGTTGE